MTRSVRSAPAGALWDADDALEQLYASHYRELVRLAVLLVHDVATAEEVVQDSFVAMHSRWRSLREPDKALAYLRQTVVNRARSALRRRVVAKRYAEEQAGHLRVAGTTVRGADEETVDAQRRSVVLAALQQLSERQREVLTLRYYLDLDEASIAHALGISRGSVKSHASRGAAALRILLEESR